MPTEKCSNCSQTGVPYKQTIPARQQLEISTDIILKMFKYLNTNIREIFFQNVAFNIFYGQIPQNILKINLFRLTLGSKIRLTRCMQSRSSGQGICKMFGGLVVVRLVQYTYFGCLGYYVISYH